MNDVVTKEEMKTRVFKVPVGYVQYLEVKIAELNKKAVKLGTTENRIVLGDVVTIKNKKEHANSPDTFTEYQLLTVEGAAPMLSGWSFMGKLEPHEAGTIVKSIPGQTIPHKFFTSNPMHCEHCKTNRYRKETFVVKKGSDYLQVGRACLKDFMGHASPEKFAAWAEILQNLEATISDYENDNWGGSRVDWVANTVETVASAFSAIQRDGFVGTNYEGNKEPTKYTMSKHFNPPTGLDAKYHTPLVVTDSHTASAKLCIVWIQDKAKSNNDEFWQNLNKFVSVQNNTHKAFGYLAAAVMMYEKEQGNIAVKAKITDGIVDSVIAPEGTKVTLDVEIISAHKYQRQAYHYNDSGVSQILTMKTKGGNLIKMFTTNLVVKVGDVVGLSGKLGRCEKESFDKSPFKGIFITMMAPRARLLA
jgi:hypothetical protein